MKSLQIKTKKKNFKKKIKYSKKNIIKNAIKTKNTNSKSICNCKISSLKTENK